MPDAATFLSAFLVGLLGAGHCVGMCGGIAGVLSIGTETLPAGRRLLRVIAYNAGRIASYTAAGAVAGLVGATLGGLLAPETARKIAMGVSAAFLVLLALYMVGRGGLLVRLEALGGRLWRYLKPLGLRLIPARTAGRAFGLGLVWGWLPCGLVYTALAWALASGSAARGALLMLGFGLGTLPALVSMGMAGSWMMKWRDRPVVRYAAGVVLVGMAATALWHGFGPAPADTGHMH
jgi:sulfite exporter TauE/SafE